MRGMDDNDMIPVCANCLRASCWQAIFVCDQYQTADVIYKRRGDLAKRGLEHPSYLKTDQDLAPMMQD